MSWQNGKGSRKGFDVALGDGAQLEILGEALKMAMVEDLELEGKIPEARRIVGIRNRIIHGYDCVDDEIIWDVVTRKLAPLAKILAKKLAG